MEEQFPRIEIQVNSKDHVFSWTINELNKAIERNEIIMEYILKKKIDNTTAFAILTLRYNINNIRKLIIDLVNYEIHNHFYDPSNLPMNFIKEINYQQEKQKEIEKWIDSIIKI